MKYCSDKSKCVCYPTGWELKEWQSSDKNVTFLKKYLMTLRNLHTLYTRQQKRHRCIEQSSGLCGRGQRWDDFGEWHWNMYIIICGMKLQSRFDAWYRMLRARTLGGPREMIWGGRWEGGAGWGTRVHPSWFHVDVWQNQYNIVKWKKKKKEICLL